MTRLCLLAAACALMAACASGPQADTTQRLSPTADAPYQKFLVVALFDSFDMRRYMEQEIVKQLKARGVEGVAMTTMSDTRTIMNRDTILDRVQKTGAEAVMVTQLVSFESQGKTKDARPEATYNFYPTYWYNVFEVNLVEYVGPQYTQFTDELELGTDVFSVKSQERVWAMSSSWTIKEDMQPGHDYSRIVDEAESIVDTAVHDKVIAR